MKKSILAVIFTGCFIFSLVAITQTINAQTIQYLAQEKDHEFVEKVLEKGQCQISLARLAQTKGLSSQVQQFATQMEREHQKTNEELTKYAQQNNYASIPVEMNDDSKKDHEKLSGKLGSEFDKVFAKQMVKNHEKMIRLFKEQIEDGKDEQLKTWASQTLPVLEQHLESAKALHESVKKGR
ncbi:DUF4142 domain-containing protein [Polluticaenibacter yanchengensis]|uniref:DUF4142 domain-containing protein n=1 Tax=Polluticaenibacter yanchengensis TaxID=3014562 RepID=A0ABT4UF88_9BACT|nr:DUF4142 domain-containing protein [Chitinophagaceae bacterium LY-5]